MSVVDEARRVLPEIEFDLLVVEKLDDDMSCDGTECIRPATWSLRCENCAAVVVSCLPHKAAIDLDENAGFVIWCVPCGQEFSRPMPWLPL